MRYVHIAGFSKVTLLLLISFVIFSHAVTPHQHVSVSCNVPKNIQADGTSKETSPLKCHYSSDFVFYKIVDNPTNSLSRYKQLVNIPVCIFGLYAFDIIPFNGSVVQSNNIFDSYFVNSTPTRGSPMFFL